jgi:hypothetical protein
VTAVRVDFGVWFPCAGVVLPVITHGGYGKRFFQQLLAAKHVSTVRACLSLMAFVLVDSSATVTKGLASIKECRSLLASLPLPQLLAKALHEYATVTHIPAKCLVIVSALLSTEAGVDVILPEGRVAKDATARKWGQLAAFHKAGWLRMVDGLVVGLPELSQPETSSKGKEPSYLSRCVTLAVSSFATSVLCALEPASAAMLGKHIGNTVVSCQLPL